VERTIENAKINAKTKGEDLKIYEFSKEDII
jgi:hypothetical protein